MTVQTLPRIRDFADPDVALPGTDPVDPEAPAVALEEKIVALLK